MASVSLCPDPRHAIIARMTTPRKLLVDPVNECDYHLVSRCVRRSYLCGPDPLTGRDFSHRRAWLLDRLRLLVPCFAIDLYAYTVMSNHFHLAVRHDPLACRAWSDAEVAARWFDAFPPVQAGEVVAELKPERRELMLGDPARLARARATLGSLSQFMKHLKQPIARRANLEDGCGGHFFEQRFYSGALLTEEALVAAMAYIDLNPVRAGLVKRIEDIRDSSIYDRLQENSAEALEGYLRPVMSGLGPFPEASPAWPNAAETDQWLESLDAESHVDSVTAAAVAAPEAPIPENAAMAEAVPAIEREPSKGGTEDDVQTDQNLPTTGVEKRPPPATPAAEYVGLLRGIAEAEREDAAPPSNRVGDWMARTQQLKKPQRAYGTEASLRQWTANRSLQLREAPLPA